MGKEIDLEKILESEVSYHMRAIIEENPNMKEYIIDAMKKACKQTLYLATQNAEAVLKDAFTGKIWQEYNDHYPIVNKQSILNTINQIK